MNALVGADGNRAFDGRKGMIAAVRSGCSTNLTPAAAQAARLAARLLIVPAFIGIDNERCLGRGGAHRGNARGIAALLVVAAELDLEQRAARPPWRRLPPSPPGTPSEIV